MKNNISITTLALLTAASSISAQEKSANASTIEPQSAASTQEVTAEAPERNDVILPLWEPQNKYLSISLGAGINDLTYKLSIGDRTLAPGGVFNMDYNIFVNQNWGLSFGAGVALYNSKSTINNKYKSTVKIPLTYSNAESKIEESDFYTDFVDWEEKQRCIALETPIGALYRRNLKSNMTLLAGAGAHLSYPVKTTYRVVGGKRVTTGHIGSADVNFDSDLPQHGYTTNNSRPEGTTETKHFSAGVYADVNLVHRANKVDFFYGIYGTFGLLNITNNSDKTLSDSREYCGVLASNVASDVTLRSAGVRVGVKIPCPRLRDEDNDGVFDKFDKCPGTPSVATVDTCGCPIDTDKDSVPDYLDKCPNTPAGIAVDSVGCPIDSDNDGVPDYLDKCPNTPYKIAVDANGCPFDTDGDGVPDYLDKCLDTPAGTRVDANGCPLDADGDGVDDLKDECPDTPEGVKVDEKGCPVDSDGDGIADYLDKCPSIAGSPKNNGCPEISAKVQAVFKQAMRGIQFETSKAVIKKASYTVLNKVVKVMKDNPSYKLYISGHTDNVGNAANNMKLSRERAAAVASYITKKGIKADRLRSDGWGDTKPVASNKTEKGRKLNRRVDFEVEF